ncbi:biopolymer transporter ExbD [Pseudomonadota bacterium]|nr:biopolymer transporter ExbD [Pseudomonadota bacterium]
MKFPLKSNPAVNIEITPLIDIVFILVIFFVATSKISESQFLNIDLPESNYLESNEDNLNNQIIVKSNGEIIIGSKIYQSDEINLEMALLDNLTVENVVILSIEKKVYHEQTIAIMDLLQKNNFIDIKIKTLSQ